MVKVLPSRTISEVGLAIGVDLSPMVIPSVVRVAPAGGNGIVSVPTTILLGPITRLEPSASVIV